MEWHKLTLNFMWKINTQELPRQYWKVSLRGNDTYQVFFLKKEHEGLTHQQPDQWTDYEVQKRPTHITMVNLTT